MTRRRDEDHYPTRPRPLAPADLGPLFANEPAPAWAQRWSSLSEEERRAQRERWQEKLQPLVLEMAARRGSEGITASDVISAGITAGVLNGERSFMTQHPRIYSWVGAWLAQLARSGMLHPKKVRLEGGGEIHVTRESTRDASHGNAGLVYVRAA